MFDTLIGLIGRLDVPATTFLGLFTTFIAIMVALINIILKTIAQKELIKNQRIECQINLIKMFIELRRLLQKVCKLSCGDYIKKYPKRRFTMPRYKLNQEERPAVP
jgi:hypothetical protein